MPFQPASERCRSISRGLGTCHGWLTSRAQFLVLETKGGPQVSAGGHEPAAHVLPRSLMRVYWDGIAQPPLNQRVLRCGKQQASLALYLRHGFCGQQSQFSQSNFCGAILAIQLGTLGRVFDSGLRFGASFGWARLTAPQN